VAEEFKARRDSSTNNVPVVGYNDGVDAQDVILFGACKVVESLVTDGTGKITLSHQPVSITGVTFTDTEGIRRGRNLNDDIEITSSGGATKYYAGSVLPIEKILKVYSNINRTTVVSGTQVVVTYYKRVPIKVNDSGELIIEGQNDGTQNVNILSSAATLPVAIKSSDITLTEKQKSGIILKKETSLAAGASANSLDIIVGDTTKDMYLTSAIAYYDGTGSETDPYLTFWFDVADSSSVSTFSLMDLPLPPKTKAPMQVDFGPGGIKVPAGSKLRFRVNANFTTNKIHAMAFGYQYSS